MNLIDPNLPLELDDGTPVEFIRIDGPYIYARVTCSPYRDNRKSSARSYAYHLRDGLYVGGNDVRYKKLRNASVEPEGPEDWQL